MAEGRLKIVEIVPGVWTVEEPLTPIIKKRITNEQASQ
jgi:hypothetical protein